ncbi:MAG TPA: LysM peptidoglycan-binding domain-containing M23 family metallopeptidase [Candidatus Hydrogenedentes bacterium]|nr:LysM peptidoglycan-binding domain-containing M23 family metallopeptidase [Candidatus Hydrogenedentota bacterium]
MRVVDVKVHPAFQELRTRHLPPAQTTSAFSSTLAKALQTSAKTLPLSHTVQSGENLSGIVRSALIKQGNTPSNAEVYSAVDRVAKANSLKNPDILSVGQNLDLSALQTKQLPVQQGGPIQLLDRAVLQGPRYPGSLKALVQQILTTPSEKSTNTGTWASPLHASTEITSSYGLRKDPFTGKPDFHQGIDLAAAKGANIYPIQAGAVTYSGWKSGYGQVVVVKHENGIESLYAHASKNLAKVGDMVTENTIIAQVGSTGRSTGPHLHLEVRRNDQPVNPSPYLAAARLRLAKNQ